MIVEQSSPPTSIAEPPAPAAPMGVHRLRELARTRSRRSRLIVNALTVVVTVGFSYLALSNIKLGQAWDDLRTSNYVWLLPALVPFALSIVARALRWRSLFAPGRRPPVGAVANAMMIGYLYNSILPARAGEPARIWVLTRRTGVPPVEIVGTAVLERLYDILAILVIFFVAEPWLPHVSWLGTAAVAAGVLASAIAIAAGTLAVYGDRPLRFLLRPLGRLPFVSGDRLERTVEELTHGLSGLRNPRVALAAFLWTSVAWLLSGVSAWVVMQAFPLHLAFASGLLIVVVVGLSMILPSPPSALGVFEGAAILALKAYGVGKTAALPYALVLHAVNFVPFIVVGALLVHHNARRPGSDLRREPPVAP